jgi:D-arabinan exo alpha-(1,3)/(1,5)-arabinofuranosidase (non-reducing end)
VRIRSLSLALLAASLALPSARAAEKVTLDGLLKQMTDLSLLAEYPDPPHVTKQFSSYDRASEAPGKESWFANADRGFVFYDGVVNSKTDYYLNPMRESGPEGTFHAGTRVGLSPTHKPVGGYVWAYATSPDGGAIDGKIPQGYIRKDVVTLDAQGHVLAEMDGPGAVVCIWSADPADAGNIRIYLDESKDPVIDAPLAELLGGKWKTKIDGKETTPFPDPIACERSRGFNLYFPIAYAKHCKITSDKSNLYYHVDYRTYPKGTEVETFTFEALSLKKNWDPRKDLRSPNYMGASKAVGFFVTPDAQTIAAGKSKELIGLATDNSQIIKYLEIRLSGVKDKAAALRSLVVIGTFDGAKTPQIWCPLGDFFGSAPGANTYQSIPLAVSQKEDEVMLSCFWCMPFEKSASFEVHNFGTQDVTVRAVVYYLPKYLWTDRSMYFHAKWRTADMKTRPFHDWTYCDLKGKGVFVGDVLSLMSPVGAWWGEGDEKIFVDGEKFPSWFGTGSEDYYGYAWSNPEPFQHPYHNQTRCDGKGTGATRGNTSVNRFHILDAIPFEKSFRFDMEVWHWDPNVTVNYAATSYWYARPDATDDFEPVDAAVLEHIPAAPPLPPPFKIKGALEGEALKVLGKSSDFPLGPQDLRSFQEGKWSGDAHLWGQPRKAGEWADLQVPVPADGKYEIIAYLTKARDYGVIQFSLDGKPLGKPIDGYEPEKVVSTGPISLGTLELKKGNAVLRVEAVGTNDKSTGIRYMWGLDCVVLKPAP